MGEYLEVKMSRRSRSFLNKFPNAVLDGINIGLQNIMEVWKAEAKKRISGRSTLAKLGYKSGDLTRSIETEKIKSTNTYSSGTITAGHAGVLYAAIHEFGGMARPRGTGSFLMKRRSYIEWAYFKNIGLFKIILNKAIKNEVDNVKP